MRSPKRMPLVLVVPLTVALLGACSSAPTTHYYLLAPKGASLSAGAPASDSAGLTVGVEPFTVDPPYDRDQLVYRLGLDSVEVGFYTYHRWAAPLGDLVALSLAEGLQGTPGIRDEGRHLQWNADPEAFGLCRGHRRLRQRIRRRCRSGPHRSDQ